MWPANTIALRFRHLPDHHGPHAMIRLSEIKLPLDPPADALSRAVQGLRAGDTGNAGADDEN